MALVHADFPSGQSGLYGTSASLMLDGVYAQILHITLVEDPDPLVTGNVARLAAGPTGLDAILRKVLPTSGYTFGWAGRVWLPGLPVTASRVPILVSWRNISNVDVLSVRVETDGRVSAYRGSAKSGGVLLGTSANPALVANAWQHVEIKGFMDATTGTIEVRVGGIVVLALSAQNTLGATGPATQYATMATDNGTGFGYIYYLKDHIAWDTNGSSNNDFLGSVSVVQLIPDGDVALTWTPTGSVTGWGAVDESPPDDNTTYISAADPPPAADTMTLTNLPADVTSVRGLIVFARSVKTDGGDGNLQMGLVSGASTALGSDRPITTAYTYWSDVFELDPATGAAWLPAAVDAVQLQIDRTT